MSNIFPRQRYDIKDLRHSAHLSNIFRDTSHLLFQDAAEASLQPNHNKIVTDKIFAGLRKIFSSQDTFIAALLTQREETRRQAYNKTLSCSKSLQLQS